MDILAIAAAVIAVALIGMLGIVLVRHSELVGQLRQLNEVGDRASRDLAQSLETRIEALTKRLGEGIDQASQRTGTNLTALSERLAVIDAAQAQIARLSTQVVGLQDILSNKQARGAFGEVQLEAIVRDALPAGVYTLQATLSNGTRADCLVRLPNPPGSIVIDAKFPLESYRALRAAGDDIARQAAARAFASAVQKHVDDIAEKYIIPGETAESALMFLPSEAVYAELHAGFGTVVENAGRRRVWLVSPTTLMATLVTVRAVLKDARVREQAHLIQKEVGQLALDAGRLAERVGKLGRHFAQAEQDVRDIGVSAEGIVRHATRIGSVDLATVEVETPASAPQLEAAEKKARQA